MTATKQQPPHGPVGTEPTPHGPVVTEEVDRATYGSDPLALLLVVSGNGVVPNHGSLDGNGTTAVAALAAQGGDDD